MIIPYSEATLILFQFTKEKSGFYAFALASKAKEWCKASLGYEPDLSECDADDGGCITFRDQHDADLFRFAFAEHIIRVEDSSPMCEDEE
jgi:hypothetical protein